MFARWARAARCQSGRAVPNVCSATIPARLGCRRSTSLAQLPSGLLHLWTTPVLFERGAGSAPLCEQLTRRAIRLHEQHALALQVAVDPIDDLDAGGSFYQWQCEQHASAEPSGAYEEMVSSPEFERLRLLVHASVERYLGELEVALPEDAPLDLFIWATVLRADQDHAVHFHPSAVCSGSFYSQVPAGAGGLWLQDPRGTLPPFTQRIKFAPSNGDLVVFPSWLQHQVALGQNSGELRVSWSFNLETEAASTWPWDCTSGVAVQHP